MKIRFISCFVAVLICQITFSQNDRRATTARTIKNHIKDRMVGDGSYKSYSFGELVRNEPKEFLELEELTNVEKALPSMKKHYTKNAYDSVVIANDKAIQFKKREIIEKNIRPDFQMVHSFLITDKTGINKVYKMDFYIDFDYKITDVRLIYSTVLTEEQLKYYYYFEKHIPVFEGSDSYRNNYLSRQMYKHFEDGLKESKYDLEILDAALRAVKIVKDHGELNLDKLGELSIKDWVKANSNNIEGYK